jgi:hypothetical protein
MYVLLFTLAISNGNLCCNINFLSLLFRVSEVGALTCGNAGNRRLTLQLFRGGFRST